MKKAPSGAICARCDFARRFYTPSERLLTLTIGTAIFSTGGRSRAEMAALLL